MIDLVAYEWYQQLIEDLKDAITESEFTARWTVICLLYTSDAADE